MAVSPFAIAGPGARVALTRRDVGLFILAAFVIASLQDVSMQGGILAFLDSLARQNLFFGFAVFVAAQRLWASDTRPVSWFDYASLATAIALFGFTCFLGQPAAAGLAMSFLVMGYAARPSDPNFRSALIVMGALAINSFWGPLIFQTFTEQIIGIDVTALRLINAILRPDIVAYGATFKSDSGFAIIIIGACSVFNNASVAVLVTTAISQKLKTGLVARDFVAVAVVLLVMLLLNTCRLALVGWSRENYWFFHSGPGVAWLSAGETLVIAGTALLCARWAARK